MSNSYPIKMHMQLSHVDNCKEVYVYDFIHDIQGSFDSMALCWVPDIEAWNTVPVCFLKPILPKYLHE